METKARELGIGKTLYYLFPQNGFLNDTDISKAAVLEPRLDSQMLADLHIGGGGAVATAETLFSSKNISQAGLKIGAANAETNADTHVFVRAMTEAADLNSWFNAEIAAAGASNRLHFRAASFCTASSNAFDNWDREFTSNRSWIYQAPEWLGSIKRRKVVLKDCLCCRGDGLLPPGFFMVAAAGVCSPDD